MYHRQYTLNGVGIMTIKRRIFISNIRMLAISVSSLILIIGLVRLLAIRNLDIAQMTDIRMIVIPGTLLLSLVIISLFNNFLTIRMTRHIVKPLEPLKEGVRQIQTNNLAYRINYENDDEFSPVCEAFNEMAAKLETSTAQKIKDDDNRKELITGISHDLRTPLTSIIVCAEGIEAGVASTPEMQKQYIASIKNEAVRMKHIIEQLFLFSKLDMIDFPLNLMRVDISLAISEMLEDSLAGYKENGLSISFAEMPKDKFISVDVFLLRNVVVNIIENSINYKTKEQGHLEISATVEGDIISLRFADDGPGVEADALPKLLDVFYRSDPSRSKIGSGLGLAISAKIIQSMRGTIDAELPPQGGLTIVISLPISQGEGSNGR